MHFKGVVERGSTIGRTLGFPTANIPLTEKLSGIFAGTVTAAGATHTAAIYADQKNNKLEAHLLDFEGDLYGQDIAVEILEKIRDDRAFKDSDEAKQTISVDIAAVRAYFNSR